MVYNAYYKMNDVVEAPKLTNTYRIENSLRLWLGGFLD